MRLVAGHSTGGANLEWFSILPDGTRVLLNDTSNTNALLAYQALVIIDHFPPTMNPPTLANGFITLSWNYGVLQEATSLGGQWSDSANQTNPQTIPASGPMKFYRIRGQ
jgi:hypothetical protein